MVFLVSFINVFDYMVLLSVFFPDKLAASKDAKMRIITVLNLNVISTLALSAAFISLRMFNIYCYVVRV